MCVGSFTHRGTELLRCCLALRVLRTCRSKAELSATASSRARLVLSCCVFSAVQVGQGAMATVCSSLRSRWVSAWAIIALIFCALYLAFRSACLCIGRSGHRPNSKYSSWKLLGSLALLCVGNWHLCDTAKSWLEKEKEVTVVGVRAGDSQRASEDPLGRDNELCLTCVSRAFILMHIQSCD